MARPATTGTEERWKVIADLVRERRDELNLRGKDIEAAGVSRSVLSLIENHKQDRYESRILRNLERVLLWAPKSIDAVLSGGSPAPLTGAMPPGTAPASEQGFVDVSGLPEEDVAMIEAHIQRLKRLNGLEED